VPNGAAANIQSVISQIRTSEHQVLILIRSCSSGGEFSLSIFHSSMLEDDRFANLEQLKEMMRSIAKSKIYGFLN
jgi:2-phosphoglycerate kinase